MTPAVNQITVTYGSSHFANKDRCPNVLPYAEAWIVDIIADRVHVDVDK